MTATRRRGRPGQASRISSGSSVASRSSWRRTVPSHRRDLVHAHPGGGSRAAVRAHAASLYLAPGAASADAGESAPIGRRGRCVGDVAAAATPDDGWTTEISSGLALAGFLFLVFVGFTLLAMGPLISLDTYFNLDPPPPGWVAYLHVLDRIGQRAVCLPVLAVATWWPAATGSRGAPRWSSPRRCSCSTCSC